MANSPLISIDETPTKITKLESKQSESIEETPVKSDSESKKSQESSEATPTEIRVKIPDLETSQESVEENLAAKMPIGREEKEEREILAANASMPGEDVVSLAWKDMVDNDLRNIHLSIDALDKRTEKMEQNSVQISADRLEKFEQDLKSHHDVILEVTENFEDVKISADRLEKFEQDLKLHHDVVLKVTENLEDVKKSTLSEKITSSVTLLLIAITVLIGYNLALFVLGKNCIRYLSGLLVLTLLGICSFCWLVLATILESSASDKTGVNGTDETGGDATDETRGDGTGENGNSANGGDVPLTARLLSQGTEESTSKCACIPSTSKCACIPSMSKCACIPIFCQCTEASARKYAWIPIIVVCLFAMVHTVSAFCLVVFCPMI